MPAEVEQRYFDLGLKYFGHDLAVNKARASAWATGNIEALQKLAYTAENGETCMDEYLNQAEGNNPQAFAKIKAKSARMEAAWMQAAEAALKKHAVSLTTKPISVLLDKKGLLQQFIDKGYEVVAPE
ncbi:MAG: hypothetical protein QM808_03550 [Steroidobacteraceae bacterium]